MTEGALPGVRALALIGVVPVDAGPAVLTGLRGALVNVRGAIGPGESWCALANGILVDLPTSGTVEAGIRGAGVVHLLAGRAGEALGTGATILVRSGVLAGAAVLAWLVGAAVVQVLVAQYSTPVGVAYALPARAVAVAVLAARIGRALVAQLAAPAVTTLALAADVTVAVDRMTTLLADG